MTEQKPHFQTEIEPGGPGSRGRAALFPPTEDRMAWLLSLSGGVVSALWLPPDRLWMIGGAFLSPQMAAACGYTIYGGATGE